MASGTVGKCPVHLQDIELKQAPGRGLDLSVQTLVRAGRLALRQPYPTKVKIHSGPAGNGLRGADAQLPGCLPRTTATPQVARTTM